MRTAILTANMHISIGAVFMLLALQFFSPTASAGCGSPHALWPKIQPIATGVINSRSNLMDMLKSAPQNANDTPRVIMVNYEADSVVVFMSYLIDLISLHKGMKSETDRKTVATLFEEGAAQEIKVLSQRISIINGYIAQMQNQSLIQQSITTRDSVVAVRDMLTSQCQP